MVGLSCVVAWKAQITSIVFNSAIMVGCDYARREFLYDLSLRLSVIIVVGYQQGLDCNP